MKKFCVIILSAFVAAVFGASTDQPYIIFVGSNYSDIRNFTLSSNMSLINGTKFFDPTKPSVLLIHGYRDGYIYDLGETLVDAFLERGGYNIMFGQWNNYAKSLDYPFIVAQLDGISKVFVELLERVNSTGYELTRIYPIGHSLGAHIAGKIGWQLKQKRKIELPRITGLDPAGPLFNPPTVMNFFGLSYTVAPGNMLTKGNARFVDIIHTNAGEAGTNIATGDVDFWPNGGKNQPVCQPCKEFNIATAIDCSICDHRTAWIYYAWSVMSSIPNFISSRCPGNIYSNSTCLGPEMASMGFHTDPKTKPGNYFVATMSKPPYSKIFSKINSKV